MTLVVNLFGAPGAGKSTTATGVFHKLKLAGYNVEYVPEVAKDFTWEERQFTLRCQPYVFGKQYKNIWRLLGKVDAIITDSPLALSLYYTRLSTDNSIPNSFLEYVQQQSKAIGGINYFLNRVKKYNPKGRNQTEEESDNIAKEIKYILDLYHFEYNTLDGNEAAVGIIFEDIAKKLN